MGELRLEIVTKFLSFYVRMEDAQYSRKRFERFRPEDSTLFDEVEKFLSRVEEVYGPTTDSYLTIVTNVRENLNYLRTIGEKEKKLDITEIIFVALHEVKAGLYNLDLFIQKSSLHSPTVTQEDLSMFRRKGVRTLR